jgi:hypothetical protein
MTRYRANILDSDGQFRNAIHMDFAADDEAIEGVKRMVLGYDVELWEGNRKIAALKSSE